MINVAFYTKKENSREGYMYIFSFAISYIFKF